MSKKKYRIGVDLGGTNIKIALVDMEGRIVYSNSEPTGAEMGYEYTINNIKEMIRSCLRETKTQKEAVESIGIGVPGQVDFERGIVSCLPNIPGWVDIPLSKMINEEFDLPVGVDNDVNCAALGEFYYGAGKGSKNVVCITVGTGVGAGIILNGQLIRGISGAAGEVGHLILQDNGGEICGCGNTGCLESLASGPSIVKMARDYIAGGKTAKFREIAVNARITPKIVAEAAKQGDAVSKKIYEITGYWLGIALANVVNLLNPEKIIIGGGVAQADDILLEPVRETIKKRALKISADAVKIVPAQLEESAGVVGASLLLVK